MPWLLRDDSRTSALKAALASATTNPPSAGLERLFALGMDAYLLSRVIPYLESKSGVTLSGVSGDRLEVGGSGHIERHLDWAQFENGEPELLDDREVSYVYENIQPDPWTQTDRTSGAGTLGGTPGSAISY